jgi:hypothetical protein
MKSGKASSEAPATVAEELAAIDTSVLDELLERRSEEMRIREYRERANAMKDDVDPLVWQRVIGDYSRRLATVEAQSKPLKARGRQEYAKLRVLIDRVTKEQKAAQIAKSELEFRHAVGELDNETLADRMGEPAAIIARCDDELAAIGELKTRFIDAFGSEAELEAPAPPEAAPKAAAPASVPVPAPEPAGPETSQVPRPVDDGGETNQIPAPALDVQADATILAPASDLPADATILAPTSDLPADATVLAPMPVNGAAGDDAGATILQAPADSGEEHTFLLPAAALLIEGNGTSSEYRLAAVNYLGRSDDNHLQLARPGVSRRHAVIMAASGGFVIQDLGSQNGVFVNGERVTEHPLKDGEQVVIGDSVMTFRMPWPQSRRADSPTRATKA